MEITNKTKGPLRVPLPGGKRLFLSPGRSGQIAPKAAEHPPLKALIEAGELEIVGPTGGKRGGSGGGGGGVSSSQTSSGGGTIRHTGDR